MSSQNRYNALLGLATILLLGIIVAAINLGTVFLGLNNINKVLFVVHAVTVGIFAFIFKKICEKKVTALPGKANCVRTTIQATVLFIFISGIIIVFSIAK